MPLCQIFQLAQSQLIYCCMQARIFAKIILKLKVLDHWIDPTTTWFWQGVYSDWDHRAQAAQVVRRI